MSDSCKEIQNISFIRFTLGDQRRLEGAILQPLAKHAKSNPLLAKAVSTKVVDIDDLEASFIWMKARRSYFASRKVVRKSTSKILACDLTSMFNFVCTNHLHLR